MSAGNLPSEVCEACGGNLTKPIPVYIEGIGLSSPAFEREDCGFMCLNPQCRMSFQFSNTRRLGITIQRRRMSIEEYEDLMRGYWPTLHDSRSN